MTTEKLQVLLFWDQAEVEERCVVPCWPVDANGDAFDCESLLYGVMLEPRWFQALDVQLPPFDPGNVTFSCPIHSGGYKLIGYDPQVIANFLAATVQRCRVCGCSQFRACGDDTTGPCAWVDDDLCSSCG